MDAPKKLRLIQCGVGGHGLGWLKNTTTASADFDLVAVADTAPAALTQAAAAAGVAPEKCFPSLQAALDKIPADAVLTVTPPRVHVEHARLAFSRGLHLMTEKPIAENLDDARLMVTLARKAKCQLVVSQNYRYRGVFDKLRQLLTDKVVGDFGHGHLDFYIPADFTGSFRQSMEHVLLVDMAIHHLDLIRHVCARNIVRVFADSFRPGWSWYQHQSALKMILELDGGEAPDGLSAPNLPFSYSGDWSARGQATPWNGNWRLQCSEGSIHLVDDKITIHRSSRNWGKDATVEGPLEIPAASVTADIGQAGVLRSFAQAIRTGHPAPTSGEDNLWSFGAVMAGVASAQQGKPIDVAKLIGKRKSRRKQGSGAGG